MVCTTSQRFLYWYREPISIETFSRNTFSLLAKPALQQPRQHARFVL